MGTGRETWPSSFVFLSFLRRAIPDLCNWSFVELGAGTGYVSLNLAIEGARMVVSTDADSRVLKNLRQSVFANKVNSNMNVLRWDWSDKMPTSLPSLLRNRRRRKREKHKNKNKTMMKQTGIQQRPRGTKQPADTKSTSGPLHSSSSGMQPQRIEKDDEDGDGDGSHHHGAESRPRDEIRSTKAETKTEIEDTCSSSPFFACARAVDVLLQRMTTTTTTTTMTSDGGDGGFGGTCGNTGDDAAKVCCLACDTLYGGWCASLLPKSIGQFLHEFPGSTALLFFKIRDHGEACAKFLANCAQLGLEVEKMAVPEECATNAATPPEAMRLFRLTLR